MYQSGLDYFEAAQAIVARIRATQSENLSRAASICSNTIAQRGLVYLFGTGHSRMAIEEMFPRHGSYPGFYPLVELSLTFHNLVVGANGQRQAMYLEHVAGLARPILRNFVLATPDSFILFSNSGVNELIVEMALQVKERGLPLIAVVSLDHCLASPPKHPSGKRLPDLADVTIDNGTPAGDALVRVPDLRYPVGPGSTIGNAVIVNALKCLIAEELVRLGQPPAVLTSAVLIGEQASQAVFDQAYDDYRTRARRAFGEGI